MNLLRLGAILSLLSLLLPAQGVTEVIPQLGFGRSSISADGGLVVFQVGTSPFNSDVRIYETATGVTTTPIALPGGAAPNSAILKPVLSGNGQFILFETLAGNLGLYNGIYAQLYVLDRQTGQLEIVSKSSAGVIGNNAYGGAGGTISDDGRYVAFSSQATNLVPGDTNGVADVFVHDRLTHVTTRISANGAYQATGHSSDPVISGDGNWIYFKSSDPALAGGYGMCLHHRPTGSNSLPHSGAIDLPGISRYGQHISFKMTNGLTYVKDLTNGSLTLAAVLPDGWPVGVQVGLLSPDGGFLYFEHNEWLLVNRRFLRDLAGGVTHRINLDSGGIMHDDTCYQQNGYFICDGSVPGGVSDHAHHVSFSSRNAGLAPGSPIVPPPGPYTQTSVYIHHRTPHLGAPASVAQGSTASLSLSAVEHPGNGFVVGLSTGYTPGILVDWRWAPLVPSDLLTYSLTPGSPYFLGFQGTLDASGNGAASIQVPVAPGLSGANFRAAFAVLSPTAPSGIAAFSNAAPIVIQ